MKDARPAPFPVSPVLADGGTSDGAGLSARDEWLAQIRVHDLVEVYFGKSSMGTESVTSAPLSLITIGKHARKVSFNRKNGQMSGGGAMSRWFHIERPT